MSTKKITLNELRALVKQIIKEEQSGISKMRRIVENHNELEYDLKWGIEGSEFTEDAKILIEIPITPTFLGRKITYGDLAEMIDSRIDSDYGEDVYQSRKNEKFSDIEFKLLNNLVNKLIRMSDKIYTKPENVIKYNHDDYFRVRLISWSKDNPPIP